ncbi:hypothetical protein [Burkholderia contaminans]|uniref:hypothetical protein n=1 Tax=Burkholderia contaminans TaxID=488447 RepID=UPI00158189C4|nr:hypothetical protein [Burkholderia contaminans]MCA8150646.1 hypothetical protein [Burkholderia contaminans]
MSLSEKVVGSNAHIRNRHTLRDSCFGAATAPNGPTVVSATPMKWHDGMLPRTRHLMRNYASEKHGFSELAVREVHHHREDEDKNNDNGPKQLPSWT